MVTGTRHGHDDLFNTSRLLTVRLSLPRPIFWSCILQYDQAHDSLQQTRHRRGGLRVAGKSNHPPPMSMCAEPVLITACLDLRLLRVHYRQHHWAAGMV